MLSGVEWAVVWCESESVYELTTSGRTYIREAGLPDGAHDAALRMGVTAQVDLACHPIHIA